MIRMTLGVAWWSLRHRRQAVADLALASVWAVMAATLLGLLALEVGKS